MGENACDLKFGDVFTPLNWAEFAIEKFNIFEKWLEGSTIFDPTMGEGNLLESLVEHGLKKSYTIDQLPVNLLYGNELNTEYYNKAIEKFKLKYKLDMSENFSNQDIMNLEIKEYDLIFGNPPWLNFVELPTEYKEKIKISFEDFGLFSNKSSLLLGKSRIDISAVVIFRTIKDFLREGGEACFFMPLSLLLNDGANEFFRKYRVNEVDFSIEKVFDPGSEKFFNKVLTRYCIAGFKRDKKIEFPIDYFILKDSSWIKFQAVPLYGESNPLSVFDESIDFNAQELEKLKISKDSMPRQGINTCGSNDIFIFTSFKILNNKLGLFSNKSQKEVVLPLQFIYPLLSSVNFKTNNKSAFKWVLLPYKSDSTLLKFSEIQEYPELKKYLEINIERLKARKGVIINSKINIGFWWALLGVGKYNFAPYKVVWESLGRERFVPKIFSGNWQVNQSLQAYMPANSYEEALRISDFLKMNAVENYLLSQKMAGTMNWAQPGRIKKLLAYE